MFALARSGEETAVVGEPGLDLHDWETRWEDLQEAARDDPEAALPEIVRLVGEMLVERGYQLDEPVTAEGDDPNVARDFLAARDVARKVDEGTADPGDVAAALESLGEVHDYLVRERSAP